MVVHGITMVVHGITNKPKRKKLVLFLMKRISEKLHFPLENNFKQNIKYKHLIMIMSNFLIEKYKLSQHN